MCPDNREYAKICEAEAADFLRKAGFAVLALNYRVRPAEIDIIAREKDIICFVEVKARKCSRFGTPAEAVNLPKQRKIREAALIYLKDKNLLDRRCRFDVVAISGEGAAKKFELIRDAFVADD